MKGQSMGSLWTLRRFMRDLGGDKGSKTPSVAACQEVPDKGIMWIRKPYQQV
jgi:hypothetical protein